MGAVSPLAGAGAARARTAGLPFGSPWFREQAAEFCARAGISGLFVVLATRIAAEFLQTGHLTGLMLLVSEVLVVVLTVVRRKAVAIDRTWQARVVAAASIVLVPFIHPTGGSPVPDPYTAALSAAGLAIIITGKVTLGRSFGLMPAHRGLVCSGVYRLVRHPIYAGYLITHTGFLIAHPSAWNLVLLIVSDLALMVRATYEERTLSADPDYIAYMDRVRWRVLPRVF
jgi:protein-S-isoprenylcysteine O-methyltransferase Ste14